MKIIKITTRFDYNSIKRLNKYYRVGPLPSKAFFGLGKLVGTAPQPTNFDVSAKRRDASFSSAR